MEELISGRMWNLASLSDSIYLQVALQIRRRQLPRLTKNMQQVGEPSWRDQLSELSYVVEEELAKGITTAPRKQSQ